MSIDHSTAHEAGNGPRWALKDVVAVTAGLIVVISVLFWWSLNIRLEVVDYFVGLLLGVRSLPLMTIPLSIGVVAIAYGLVTGRRLVLALVLVPVLAAALLLVAPYRMYAPKLWFQVHKPMYNAALTVRPNEASVDTPLPGFLAILSVTGTMSDSDGDRFFPLWTGIPDDAGGFIHSTRDPSGRVDMYGSMCVDAEPLSDGWWMCGLR